MGATETRNTPTSRLVRTAAAIAGLVAAIMLLGATQAGSAKAAVVGNPGTFTVTWESGEFKQGSKPFPLNELGASGGNFSFQINVDANGNYTVPGVAFGQVPIPGSYKVSGSFIQGDSTIQNIRIQPESTGAWNGQINPVTGAFNLAAPMKWRLYADEGTRRLRRPCDVNNSTNVQASTVQSGGVPYQETSGTATLVDRNFALPGANDCEVSHNVGNKSANGETNSFFGLPGSDNRMIMGFRISPAVRGPVIANIEASSGFVGEGDTLEFSAASSVVSNGVKLCDDPSPSEPGCGYRWDFTGDGTVDAVTNTPTVTSDVYSTAGVVNPRVTIFDTTGYSNAGSTSIEVQVKPLAQIDSHPPAVTKETVNEFTFSIPVNPYGATTQCSIDGAAWTACDSGDDFVFSQADDTKAQHNFRVRGITPGGVAGPADGHDFTIDRVKPRVTVTAHPVNPTNSTSASFAFTADKPNTTLECQLDGGSWSACGTNSAGSRSYGNLAESSPNPIEAPNPHKFRVRATDQYGNIGGDGNPGGGGYDWDIDLTSPVPSFTTKPANPSNDVDPVFVWENNESIQLAQCRLVVDGAQAPWQNCGSLTTRSFSDLADATYDFSVRTLDIAGNWSNVLTHRWVLETVTPPLSITSTPARYSNRTSAQFLFNAEEGSTTRCQLDGQPVQDPCPSGVKYSYLPAGTHIFSVTATDAALNETTRTYTWDIKTARPAVIIEEASLPAAASTSADAAFALTTANGDAECRLDGGSWSDCESNSAQSYEGLPDGNHTFEVRAVDEYGNVSATDAHSWLIVASSPEVSFGSRPAAKTNKSTGMFSFAVATADDNARTKCSLDGLPPTDCGSPAAVTNLSDGDHTFEVTATDTAGQTGTAIHEWSVKAKIPGLGFDAVPAALSDSQDAVFEFSSDEDPDVAYECRTDSGSFAECESPVELTALGQGTHSFTVRATDAVGNRATEAYIWKVDTIAPTVTFDQQPAETTERIAEVLKFKASENGASFACRLDGDSFADCTSPKLLKALAVGEHTFTVRATDEAGNTGPEASVSWTVTAPAPATQGGDEPVGLKGKGESRPAAPAAASKAKAKRLQKKAKRLGKMARQLRKAGKVRRAKQVRVKARRARAQARRLRAGA